MIELGCIALGKESTPSGGTRLVERLDGAVTVVLYVAEDKSTFDTSLHGLDLRSHVGHLDCFQFLFHLVL